MTWPDDASYEGSWVYGHAEGQGKFRHSSGDVYVGQWYRNKCNGLG